MEGWLGSVHLWSLCIASCQSLVLKIRWLVARQLSRIGRSAASKSSLDLSHKLLSFSFLKVANSIHSFLELFCQSIHSFFIYLFCNSILIHLCGMFKYLIILFVPDLSFLFSMHIFLTHSFWTPFLLILSQTHKLPIPIQLIFMILSDILIFHIICIPHNRPHVTNYFSTTIWRS